MRIQSSQEQKSAIDILQVSAVEAIVYRCLDCVPVKGTLVHTREISQSFSFRFINKIRQFRILNVTIAKDMPSQKLFFDDVINFKIFNTFTR